MMRRLFAGAMIFMCAAAGQALLQTTEFRTDISLSGSTITIRPVDINGNELKIDVPTTVDVEVHGGEVKRDDGQWTKRLPRMSLQAGELIPPLSLRSDGVMPEELTITAVVHPSGGHAVPGRKTVQPRAEAALAIIMAILGGVLWVIVDPRIHAGSKDRRSRVVDYLRRLLGGAVAGGVAAGLAKSETFLGIFGFSSSNLPPQTYFFLGLAVSAFGVARLVRRLFGEDIAEKSLTAQQVKSEMIKVLDEGDAVRKPVREEVQSVTFSSEYLAKYPELLPRAEVELVNARYGVMSRDLIGYLTPRTSELYTSSRREDVFIDLHCSLDGDALLWEEVATYDFIVDPRDPRQPIVKYVHEQDVPKSDRERSPEELKQLGVLIRSLELRLQTDEHHVAYAAASLQQLQRKSGLTSVEPTVEIIPTYDPKDHTLQVEYKYLIPDVFAAKKRVSITTHIISRVNLRDTIYAARMSSLTKGFRLAYTFPPGVRTDVTKYRWRRADEPLDDADDTPGIAWMKGWLVPGNGICLEWHGIGATT